MDIREYFGEWSKVIDLGEADRVTRIISKLPVCPTVKDTFKAFKRCLYPSLRCVFLGQDPYPNFLDGHPVATGIAFANSSDTSEERYSPSLNILRESVINFSVPHNKIIFDPSLESWEEQGVLLLNTALSCLRDKPCSHTLLWRPFITSFLTKLSEHTTGIVYVLMGNSAQSLEPYIDHRFNTVLKCRHPAYYARMHKPMPSDIWREVNQVLTGINGYGIKWYNEVEF